MSRKSLDYLLCNHVIDIKESKNYEIAQKTRKKKSFGSGVAIELKKNTNNKLINFTDYKNKVILDKIDSILAWSMGHPNVDLRSVYDIRTGLMINNVIVLELLENFIRANKIDVNLYTKKDKELARHMLDKYIPYKESMTIFLKLSSKQEKALSFSIRDPFKKPIKKRHDFNILLDDLEDSFKIIKGVGNENADSFHKDKGTVENDYNIMFDGLEDGIGIIHDEDDFEYRERNRSTTSNSTEQLWWLPDDYFDYDDDENDIWLK